MGIYILGFYEAKPYCIEIIFKTPHSNKIEPWKNLT